MGGNGELEFRRLDDHDLANAAPVSGTGGDAGADTDIQPRAGGVAGEDAAGGIRGRLGFPIRRILAGGGLPLEQDAMGYNITFGGDAAADSAVLEAEALGSERDLQRGATLFQGCSDCLSRKTGWDSRDTFTRIAA